MVEAIREESNLVFMGGQCAAHEARPGNLPFLYRADLRHAAQAQQFRVWWDMITSEQRCTLGFPLDGAIYSWQLIHGHARLPHREATGLLATGIRSGRDNLLMELRVVN
jgi:hypothetical protein